MVSLVFPLHACLKGTRLLIQIPNDLYKDRLVFPIKALKIFSMASSVHVYLLRNNYSCFENLSNNLGFFPLIFNIISYIIA